MYISNGLRLYFRFTPVRMVWHEAIPKRPTIKSPLLIYFVVISKAKMLRLNVSAKLEITHCNFLRFQYLLQLDFQIHILRQSL